MTLELRREGEMTATITGVASRYATFYPVFIRGRGRVQERVMPGAATPSLSRNPDVIFTAEHDRSRAVARTPASLTLHEDRTGLHYRATVDLNDPDATSIVSKIERGVFVESSFGFRVPEGGDSWDSEFTQRTIHRVDLHRGDVSAVPYGASPTTSVTVERMAIGTLAERRALAESISRSGWCGPLLARDFVSPAVAAPGVGSARHKQRGARATSRRLLPPNDTADLLLDLELAERGLLRGAR
jgi:HK97 family phage prohead protease